jgi:hypothetical protein
LKELREALFGWMIELFRKPPAQQLARRELAESRRNLLQAQRMRDYYAAMCTFETKRIASLSDALQKDEE